MSASPVPPGLPAAEPKDGDFVAYLAQIERRQLAALKQGGLQPPSAPSVTRPHTPHGAEVDRADAPLSAAQAEALRARLRQGGADAKQVLAAAVFALLGLFFIAQALFDDAGIVGLLIGGFLWWRAAVAARKLVGVQPLSSRDLATRLVDALRAAQKQSRK